MSHNQQEDPVPAMYDEKVVAPEEYNGSQPGFNSEHVNNNYNNDNDNYDKTHDGNDDGTSSSSSSNASNRSQAIDPIGLTPGDGNGNGNSNSYGNEDVEAANIPSSQRLSNRRSSDLSKINMDPVAGRRLSRALSGSDANERYSYSLRSRSRAPSNISQQQQQQKQYDHDQIPSMGKGKKLPTSFPDPEEYTVGFNDEDDPMIPTNWPFMKTIYVCLIIAYHSSCIAWSSSVFSPAILEVASEFHVGRVVATLGVSLYVLGFATGPVIWAPLSELYGRRPVLILSGLGFTIFQFGVATAKDIQTVMLCRAFGGAIGAAPMVVVPAAFADMFNNEQRGRAITIFVMTVFCVPIVSPVAGSFIVNSYLSWRWTEYISGIMGGLSLILVTFFYKESHHPIILVHKANEIKKKTGNWMIHAAHDEFTLTIKDIVEKNLTRPLYMLISEPIILLISMYNAFVYGILYLMLSAYPVIFAEGYKMNGGVSELPYLGLVVGMIIGGIFTFYMEGGYLKALKLNNYKPVPEARLPPLFFGAFAFPIGLFWLFWTGNWPNKIHWMAPTSSGVFTGFGLVTIFNASINYIIDSYLIFAASAMAANTFLRSSFACAFPLFGVQMLHNMGIKWAGLLLALIGVILIPVPFFFYKFGEKIRGKSKFAFVIP